MSLHELIYSQQSETRSVEDSFSPPPRKKRPKQELAAAPVIASRRETTSADAAALDSFYGIPPYQPPAAPDVIISNGIERRRKRKRGRPPSRRRQAQMPEEELWETVSEAERRIERTSRKKKYKEIQTRWKQRSHALQDEIDYGNAVQHMARKVMKRRRTTQRESEDGDKKPAAVPDLQQEDIDMNSSDEEQQEALGSLWTSMTPQEEDDKSELDDTPDPNDYRTWDYYQLGYDTPQYTDLQDFYYNNHARHGSSFKLNLEARAKRLQDMEPVTFTPDQKYGIRNLPNKRYYLNVDLPTTCHTRLDFHHRTCLRAMAARFLIGSAGKNVELENRLLRDLYSAPSRKMGREYHVLAQAMEHGCEFVLFKSHVWKQRAVAARILGMTPEFHLAGPKHRIGYSLERRNLVEREGFKLRNKVVRLLSNGEIPYKPDDTSDVPVNEEGVIEMIDGNADDLAECSQAGTSPETSQMEIDSTRSDVGEEIDETDRSPANSRAKLKSNSETDAETPDSPDAAKQTDPDAASFRNYLGSEVGYVHKPGTLPPVPSFPLDETGVVLGGEDRYSRVHLNAKIDDATYTATMSVMLARIGRARLEKDSRAIEEVQEQIMTYVDETVQENVIQLEKFYFMRRKRKEQPSVLYYKAMMGFCSLVANGGCLQASSDPPGDTGGRIRKAALDEDWMDDESDAEDSVAAQGNTASNMKVVAQTIHNNCAECPNSPLLTIFPRIHVTTALALIAKNLPAPAAEILSRPFDDLLHRTPFDIMRRTLEYLEYHKLLVESHVANFDGGSVSVGYLEHVVHQATEIFRQATEIDPSDILCQAWYVSGLAASLLLCSGNAISSRAHVRPSSKEREDDYDMIFSSPDAFTSGNHEVRQKMSKFAEVRRRVAMAVKKMIQTAKTESSLTGNLMVSAALEWKQVIALLVGPRDARDDATMWSDIRRLHSCFAGQWAIAEGSKAARHMVEDMVRDQEASADTMLEFLATAVENSPSDVLAWRRLVQTLGPAGAVVSSRRRKECKRNGCTDCKRLRKGMNVDHAMIAEQNTNTVWWGKRRTPWWEEHVVAADDVPTVNATASEIFQVSERIELQLTKGNTEDASREKRKEQPIDVSRAGEEFIGWLDDLVLSSDDAGDDAGFDTAKGDRIEDLLPKSVEERICSGGQADDPSTSLVFGAEGGDQRLELLCYKIMAACHLYGVCHDLTCKGIWYLAQKCQDDSTDSEEWQCLLWLFSKGLNIPQILHDVYSRTKKKERGVSSYPHEKKEAIRVGMEIFGKEWTKIRNYFDVFQDSSRSHVKVSRIVVTFSSHIPRN